MKCRADVVATSSSLLSMLRLLLRPRYPHHHRRRHHHHHHRQLARLARRRTVATCVFACILLPVCLDESAWIGRIRLCTVLESTAALSGLSSSYSYDGQPFSRAGRSFDRAFVVRRRQVSDRKTCVRGLRLVFAPGLYITVI